LSSDTSNNQCGSSAKILADPKFLQLITTNKTLGYGMSDGADMKIGFLSLPLTGHLNPMTALARKLKSRGHEVVFIGVPDIEPVVRAAGLDFVPFGENEYPPGSIAKRWGGVAKLHGLDVVRYSIRELTPGLIKAAFEHLPGTIAEADVNALILDTAYRFVEVVPMHLRLPYVQIWNILHFDSSGSTPVALYSWPHETTPEALARNVEGLQIFREYREALMPIAQSYAERNGLEIDWSNPAATVSKLAVITQTPKEFDFPIPHLPPQFHYAGPFHDNGGREPISFPWEKLTEKPLIYASMGTLVNGRNNVYDTILEAVGQFPEMQVVLAVGRNLSLSDLGPIPSNTIVVPVAPQIELLRRATLCITHAGLNTALEALAQGVPMVAIPIGYDQPGVAARIAYHGVGEFVEIGNLTARHLSELIAKVKANPNYRDKARWFQKVLGETRGLDVAADIVERVFGEHLQDKEAVAATSFAGRDTNR
jgi:zeaxanthin glucosyltransferase